MNRCIKFDGLFLFFIFFLLFFSGCEKKHIENKTEKEINDYNSYISSFLVKLSLLELAETDEKKVSSFYHVASDLESRGR